MNKCNQWFSLLILLVVPLIHKVEVFFTPDINIFEQLLIVSPSFEYMWLCLLSVSLFVKRLNLGSFLVVAILSIVLYFIDFLIEGADWVFYASPFADNILKDYHTKDKFGLIFMLIIFLLFAQIIKLIIDFIKKDVEFQKIILLLTTILIMGVGTIHHLYIIEYKYQNKKEEIWAEMKHAANMSETDFMLICDYKKWLCAKNENEDLVGLTDGIHPEIRWNIIEIFKNSDKRAQFTYTQNNPRVELLETSVNMKLNGRLMIEPKRLQEMFVRSEVVLVRKLSFASFFWYYFTICALIAHRNRKFKFKGSKKNV